MLEKQMKKIDALDVGLIKLYVAFFMLFLITAWTGFRELVLGVHWGWFLGVAILGVLRPAYRFWIK